ncbi:MAG: EI24 domain-containing protein [Opitutales bacterium]|nr:EI24 domain-containing protein [Opitutales bacterium]
MIRDFSLAFSQLSDPRLWKPILWATLLSLGAIFITILIGGAFLFQLVDSFSNSLSGWMSWADGWIKGVTVVVGTFFIGVLGYFFLASVYAAFLGIFIDDALDAVRERHYPDAPWIKPTGMIESTISSLRFIAWSLFIYLLASPLLLVGYFIPPVGLVLQFLLGGYLLGREYGQLIELRMPRENRQKKPGRLAHGTVATFLWTFPLVNLVAPLVLGASLVHARLGTNKNTNNSPSQLKPPYSSE